MTLHDARRFVAKMRADRNFRKRILEASKPEELAAFLRSEGLGFDQRELVEAMAECMEQLEQQTAR